MTLPPRVGACGSLAGWHSTKQRCTNQYRVGKDRRGRRTGPGQGDSRSGCQKVGVGADCQRNRCALHETEIKRIEDPSAGDGWNSNSSSAVTESPSFSSLDDNQASDAGGSKKTLLIAVVLLGLAAAGYFGWTKMQSAHPQAVPQSAAPGNPETPALPPQATASVPEAQPATGDLVAPQPEPGLSGTTGVPVPSKPSAAVIAEVSGGKTSAPAKATPVEDDVTVVKSPATAKTEPSPALMVHNGSSIQPKAESEAQESEQAPAVTSIANGHEQQCVVRHCEHERDQCPESSPADAKNFAGRFPGTDHQESPTGVSCRKPGRCISKERSNCRRTLPSRAVSPASNS